MIVDPHTGGRALSASAAQGLAMEVRALRRLVAWQPAAERLEAVCEALRGGEGLTPRELRRVRLWARRVRSMRPELLAFYVRHAPHDTTASVALWRVLDGGAPLEGFQIGHLRQLWLDDHGCTPVFRLASIPPSTDRSHR